MAALEALCSTGLMFNQGRLVQKGPLKEVLSGYHRLLRPDTDTSSAVKLDGRYFRRFDMVDEHGESTRTIPVGGQLRVHAMLEAEKPITYPIFVLRIENSKGQRMLTARSPRNHHALPLLSGSRNLTCTIDNVPFAPGDYSMKISMARDLQDIETVETEILFSIRNADTFEDGWGARLGICAVRSQWQLTESRSAKHPDRTTA
jgi:hypothetical protein